MTGKRQKPAESTEPVVVDAQRPRIDTNVPIAEAPENPTHVFQFIVTSPSSSPIEFVTKKVVPYVDHVLKEKMTRIVFFFYSQKNG